MSEEIALPSVEWRVQIALGVVVAVALWRLAEASEQQAYHLGRIDRHLSQEATARRDGGYDLPVETETETETESESEDEPEPEIGGEPETESEDEIGVVPEVDPQYRREGLPVQNLSDEEHARRDGLAGFVTGGLGVGSADDEPDWAMGDRTAPDGIVDGEVEPERDDEIGGEQAASEEIEQFTEDPSEINDERDDAEEGNS